MLYKTNFRKKSFLPALILTNLALTACTPSSNHHLEVNSVKNVVTSQKQSGVDYSKAIVATNPQLDEVKYVNENYTKYLAAAQAALKQAAPEQTFSEAEVIAAAKKLVQPEAADYVHFKYIADRSFSLNWTTLKPGSLFYGGSYGTGWIVDRFKNPDGSWSNDFLVSTNIHVANTIPDSSDSGIGKTDNYAGFPSDVYELAINNQVYDLENPDSNWIYPSSFEKLPNWNPQNYFTPQRRALVNQIQNNYDATPYYSLAFSGVLWNWDDFVNYDIPNIKFNYDSLYKDPKTENINWYDKRKLASYFMDKFSASKRYYNQLFFDPTNISDVTEDMWQSFYQEHKDELDLELISDEANKILNRTKTLDNAYLRITIPNNVLAGKLPIFLDPSKYNEWTFPKFTQADAFKNYSFNNYQQAYGFLGGQTKSYNLATDQQEPIWHAGYPAEQTWNGLAYNSPGPVLKTSRGLITNAIFLNPSSKKNLDHNDCQTYNSLCNDDGVAPAVYSLGSQNSNTGGGSSGSMALNKNYEVQGIYWGVQYNSGSLLDYNSIGLYEPMYSSNKLNLPTYERIPALTTQNKGAITYMHPDDTKEDQPFSNLIHYYLWTGLAKVFIAAKTDDTYNKILNLDKLKSFDYAANLEEQIQKIMATLTDGNPSDLAATSFATLISKTNNLSDVDLKDQLYTAIKNYWVSFFNDNTTDKENKYIGKFYSSFNYFASFMVSLIDYYLSDLYKKYPSATTINLTAFAKRDLGTVNMAAELQKYFQDNHYSSHVYNNPDKPLKIVDVNSNT